jgi:hypothetical protein
VRRLKVHAPSTGNRVSTVVPMLVEGATRSWIGQKCGVKDNPRSQ